MKKRILAFALSLSLAVSLAAPALAAGPEDNDYTMELSDLMELLEGNMDPALLEQYLEAQYGDDWYQTENGAWSIQWPEEDKLSLVVNGQNYPTTTLTAEDGVSYLSGATLDAIFGGKLGITDPAPIPIRPAAEEAGWDVVWNERNNQIILLDRQRLQKGIVLPAGMVDGDYFEYDFSQLETMISRLLTAAQAETTPGQTYRTTSTYDLSLTTFNTLDGDESYSLRVDTELLTRDNVIELTLSLNAADVLKLQSQDMLNELAAGLPKVTFQNLSTLLTGCKARFILNLDEGMLYWNIPLLALFDDTNTLTENTWISADLGVEGVDLAALQAEGWSILAPLVNGEWHIGDWLYDRLLERSANSWMGAEDAYTDFLSTYSVLGLFFGPETMTERGGTLTWHLTADWANAAFRSLLAGMTYYGETPNADPFKEFDVKLSVTNGGRVELAAAIRPDTEAIARLEASPWDSPAETTVMGWLMGFLDFRYTAGVSGTADRSTGNMEFHWKNQLKLNLKSSTTRQKVNTAPLSAPPAGADVVELH